jgi:SAM-dependent methyltransferase
MTTPAIAHIGHCRGCGNVDLKRIVCLPEMPFTDDFIFPNDLGKEFRADIDVFVCRSCLTAQTQHDVDVRDYYKDYHYSVGDSATATRFMQLLATNLKERYYPGVQGKKVLEVGSGDGGQLVAFRETGCHVLGFEPSSLLSRAAKLKGIQTIQGLFTDRSISRLPKAFREVDVVILSYTFDHLPNPRSFLAVARSILNKTDGLLVVEIHDLQKIIERQEFCLFEHEHSIYLTEVTAREMCQREGFEVIDFDLISSADRRANSLIFVATPAGSSLAGRTARPTTPSAFSDLGFYEDVGENIRAGIKNLEVFVDHVTGKGRTLAGYGAGGRGVMTLAAMDNASRLRYLVDKNPKRLGLVAPKSGVPLVALDALKSDPVDEILVFSFGYMREIQSDLAALGYKPNQLHSLLNVLAGTS